MNTKASYSFLLTTVPCFAVLHIFLLVPLFVIGKEVREVTQHGISWTFDRPYQAGRFVNGDRWVIGPVNIVGVSPRPDRAGEGGVDVKSIWCQIHEGRQPYAQWFHGRTDAGRETGI